jgi:UDP-N-acetylglucosamine 2-epimerase (non-hydrolysing)
MIDTLIRLLPETEQRRPPVMPAPQSYGLVTLHRPANVDAPEMLVEIMETLDEISRRLPLIFTIHPRTRQNLQNIGFAPSQASFTLIDPLSYLDFLTLRHASW